MKSVQIARRAWIFVLKVGFVVFGLLAIWLLACLGWEGNTSPWWMVIFASLGSASVGILLLGLAIDAEDELTEKQRESSGYVPVRKIDRRHSA